MSQQTNRRLLLVWVLLVGVTLASWWTGSKHGHANFTANLLITYGVVLMAAVKIRVIIMEFMEVRHAPVLLRRLTDGWLAFLVFALLGVYSLQLSMPVV